MKFCRLFIRFRTIAFCGMAFLLLRGGLPVYGQTAPAGGAENPAPAARNPATTAAPPRTVTPSRPRIPARNLAPHVFRPINPALDDLQTDFVRDINEIVAQHGDDVNYSWAKEVSFRPSIWYLSLELKPMRTIEVELPGPDGRLRRQIVWYLIYKVRNPGMVYEQVQSPQSAEALKIAKTLASVGQLPIPPERQFYDIKPNAKTTIRFVPNFELTTLDSTKFDPKTGKTVPAPMRYADRFMPLAAKAVRMREDPGREILDSVQMTLRPIQPGEEVWGMALWSGVNPTTDKFSVYISGLTNAMQWEEDLSKYTPNGRVAEGRTLKFKTLKLNYWKPGDETATGQRSEVFRMGIPDVDGGLDYLWLFR